MSKHFYKYPKGFYGTPRYAITVICLLVLSLTANAQTDTLNNINTELKLNEEAIKLIKFDFMPSSESKSQTPCEAPLDKPWMSFKQELAVPKNLTDTAKVRKPKGYIRMLPYSIWTKFGEDPVYDVMVFSNQKKYKMTFTLNPFRDYGDNYGHSLPPSAGGISDGMGINGVGLAIGGLDFVGFIYNNFTKRGRMLQHNKKHANAWKIYAGYQPTLKDSMKFPTFYNGLTAPIFLYNPKDSIHTASAITPFEELPDSVREEIEMVISTKRDSLIQEYLNEEKEKDKKARNTKRIKRNAPRKVREAQEAGKAKKAREQKALMEKKMIEELPGSMDSIYKYMREKEARKAEERKQRQKEKDMEID